MIGIDYTGPKVYLSGLSRSTTRDQWKRLYRYARVTLRESIKASFDTVFYGTGIIRFLPNGDPEHVPLADFRPSLAMDALPPMQEMAHRTRGQRQ